MKKIKKYAIFFVVGGIGYGLLEVLWRGRTHWSMLLAGGICFTIFSRIAEDFKKHSKLFKATMCALCVTAVEAAFGFVFNVCLGKNVWDYSKLPFNFMGQICLLFSLLWGILGFIFIPLADRMNKRLS